MVVNKTYMYYCLYDIYTLTRKIIKYRQKEGRKIKRSGK